MTPNSPRDPLLSAYLDGSLPEGKMAEAEELLGSGDDLQIDTPVAEYETFVERLRQACQAPRFRSEKDSVDIEAIVDSVLSGAKDQGSSAITASVAVEESIASFASSSLRSIPEGKKSVAAFLRPPVDSGEIGRLGEYRVLRKLGEGGMGMVFEAEDLKLKRRVALKVMKPEMAAKEQHRLRFLREAQTAAQVEHDHICPIYQVGEDNGVPFIAMPFLKGEPLDVILKRRKPLPMAEAVRIAREIADGLAVAHEAGLVHRDIKPGNIWIQENTGRTQASTGRQSGENLKTSDGRVRILDFGLARLQTDDVHLTASGAIMGTPAYMAPEQARGKPVDGQADLFSLGVMLYEMTTGKRPFTGSDTMSILTSLAVDEPPVPNKVNPQIPAELSGLIVRLLSKAPEKRPANARLVADALSVEQRRLISPIVEALPSVGDPWESIDDATEPVRPGSGIAKTSRARATSSNAKKSSHGFRIAFAVAILLFLFGGGLAGYKLIFESKHGTLIVEVDDDADVRFKNGKLQIYDEAGKLQFELEPSESNKSLPPGKYEIRVSGADGLRVNTPVFRLEKGKKLKVYVIVDSGWKPPPVATKKGLPVSSGEFSLLFDGIQAYVEVPSLSESLKGLTEWTVEMRLSKDKLLDLGSAWSGGLPMVLYFNGGQWILHEWQNGLADLMTSLAGTHYSAVRNKDSLRLFVDGKLVAKSILPEKPAVTSQPFRLGTEPHRGGPLQRFFKGTIGEVRISTVARYENDFVPEKRFASDEKTLALYHCDEGQGEVLKDASGNGHDGKIIGAKWVKAESTEIAPRPTSEDYWLGEKPPPKDRFFGELLAFETCDDPKNCAFDLQADGASLKNGIFRRTFLPTPNTHKWGKLGQPTSDFTLALRAKAVDLDWSLVFRETEGKEKSSLLSFNVYKGGGWQLYRVIHVQDGEFSRPLPVDVLAISKESSPALVSGEWVNLTVRALGDDVSIWANDKKLLQVRISVVPGLDGPAKYWAVAFSAHAQTPPSGSFELDYAAVWTPTAVKAQR